MTNKQRGNTKPPKSPGRPKGSPNKTTALLKDAILQAAEQAGDKKGMIGYLKKQAKDNPTSFMGLLGKVLPLQLANADDETFKVKVIERIIVEAPDQDS